MEQLVGMAFTSSMKFGLTKTARRSLVNQAQLNNQRVEISSVLLYCDGSFMQYMEGPKAAVEAIYARIEADARHRGVIKLFHCEISEREFADSDMQYCDADSQPLEVSTWLRPVAGCSNPARIVLSGFWANNNALRMKH